MITQRETPAPVMPCSGMAIFLLFSKIPPVRNNSGTGSCAALKFRCPARRHCGPAGPFSTRAATPGRRRASGRRIRRLRHRSPPHTLSAMAGAAPGTVVRASARRTSATSRLFSPYTGSGSPRPPDRGITPGSPGFRPNAPGRASHGPPKWLVTRHMPSRYVYGSRHCGGQKDRESALLSHFSRGEGPRCASDALASAGLRIGLHGTLDLHAVTDLQDADGRHRRAATPSSPLRDARGQHPHHVRPPSPLAGPGGRRCGDAVSGARPAAPTGGRSGQRQGP